MDKTNWQETKQQHEQSIIEIWGERCEDYNIFCLTCIAWETFDRYWQIMAETFDLDNSLIQQDLDQEIKK